MVRRRGEVKERRPEGYRTKMEIIRNNRSRSRCIESILLAEIQSDCCPHLLFYQRRERCHERREQPVLVAPTLRRRVICTVHAGDEAARSSRGQTLRDHGRKREDERRKRAGRASRPSLTRSRSRSAHWTRAWVASRGWRSSRVALPWLVAGAEKGEGRPRGRGKKPQDCFVQREHPTAVPRGRSGEWAA